jgi:hypothetical protein
MPELRDRFSMADEIETGDLWTEARRRADAPETSARSLPWAPAPRKRVTAAVVAFAVFVGASVFAWNVWHPDAVPMSPPPGVDPPVDLASQLPDGWSELPAPPETHFDPAYAWTGSELLIWGGGENDFVVDDGFAFDATSWTWDRISSGPLAARSDAAFAWTGDELLVWGGWSGGCCTPSESFLDDGAAYDPITDVWRQLPPAPIAPKAPLSVWTGEEMIVWGTSVRFPSAPMDGAAYDPDADSWRRIAEAPIRLTDATAVWTGEEMIVFGAALDGNNRAETATDIGAAYEPATDSWRRISDSELSPQAATAAWPGGEMIAWDYDHATAAYDPSTDAWRRLADVPLRFYECYPRSAAIQGSVLGNFCGSMAAYVASEDRWHDISMPDLQGWALELLPAGSAFLVIGHSPELSEIPGRTYDTRMLAYIPNGSFRCAGMGRVNPAHPRDARSVAERFMLLRIHDAEEDLGRLLSSSGRDAFGEPGDDLRPLRGDYIVSEVVFVDGPLALSPGGRDGAYEVGVRMTSGPHEETFPETLFLAPGKNLEGEDCPLLVQGGRSGLTGP